MNTVQGILRSKQRELFTVAPDTSVFEALQIMAAHDIGALVVMNGEELAGIFSERDYARKVILAGKSSRELRVSEIMTKRVLYVTPEQTIEECMAIMTQKHIRHLPVTKDSKVIGIVSIGDVVKEVISEQQFAIEQLIHYISN